MTSGLCNPEYYRGAFLEIRKSMEVREEGMEVEEEAALISLAEYRGITLHLHIYFFNFNNILLSMMKSVVHSSLVMVACDDWW